MKVLVAGGFGFVGARVASALDVAGHAVILGSRSARQAPPWLPGAPVRQMDWRSRSCLREACAGVDAVVNAAGMNAADCAANPAQALEVNGAGTASLVDAAVQAGVARFLYFSTAHVYANPLQGEIDEDSFPRNPHPYASSHLAGEASLLHGCAAGHIVGTSLRLSNGFGTPMASDGDCWTLLANDLCRQAVTRRRLVLRSSGEQLRDFVPLSAVCADVLILLQHPTHALPKVLNIGSGNAVSVIAMARLISERCRVTLGYAPALEPGAHKEEEALPLRYRSRHTDDLCLASTDPVAEIDALLRFCNEKFSLAP